MPRVDEAEDARSAVGLDPDREQADRRDDAPAAREQTGRRPGDEQHRAHDQGDRDRGPEVGLGEEQQAEEPELEAERLAELAERARRLAPREIRAGPDHDRDLGDLRGLEVDGTKRDPAACAVHALPRDDHAGEKDEAADDQRRRQQAETAVASAGAEDHRADPEHGEERLALQVVAGIPAADRCRRGGRAVDHDEPERDEREGDEDEQVRLELAPLHPPRFCTSRVNSSPRRSKFSNWS